MDKINPFARFMDFEDVARISQVIPSDRSAPLPLSYQQERLWFLDRFDEAAGAAYHIESALELTGPLDVAALGEALRRVVDRHEGLRATFASSNDGQPVQVIAPTADAAGFVLSEEDAAALGEKALAARVRALLARPFDLASGPLFRAHLLVCGPQRSVLVVGGHHAVLDGWSVGLLLREVAALYGEAVTGATAALPDLTVQYGDYAAWQRSVLSGDGLEAEMAWWRETLAGIPEAISLPFDRPRPKVMDHKGGTVPVHIPADVTASLKALAGSQGATLFMVLDATFAAFLHRIGGDRDIVVGTAVAGRPRSELEPLAGFFVNTIALCHEIDGFVTFTDFLGRTRQLVLNAFQHQTVPFETIVEAVSPARSLGHAPVVQVMLTLQNTPDADAALALPGVTVSRLLSDSEAAKFDLALSLTERAGGLVGTLSYACQLFDAGTAERLVAMFVRLLRGAVAAPGTPVVELPLLDEVERRQVVRAFNDTAADYAKNKTVMDLFAEQVDMRPDAIAVIDGERTLTYGALDAASNRLARHLIDQGVGPEQVVGVCLERSAELIVTLLAIWKAGGGYLPLDPSYPGERLAFMLEDAGAMAVVTTENGSEQQWLVSGHGLQPVVVLDDPATDKAIASVGAPPVMDAERIAPLTPRCLCYVIYTSGSTGRPKGVSVSHAGLLNCSLTAARQRSFAAGQRALAHASIGFDASLFEWLPSLCSGASLSMWGNAQADLDALYEFALSQQVENIFLTPAVLKQLDRLPPDVGVVGVGGDRIDPGLVASISGQVPLVNCYGPTEGTIYASACTLSPETGPSIGRPVANTRIYIVDQNLEPQPIGVTGELLIGGVQVARGYGGRPGLTAEKFIADPFTTEPGARLYRTGDLARWRSDGTLEFLGRIDHQVKIRGMRVELGEIEAQLNAQQGVRESIVVTRQNGDSDASLVAYLVPESVADPILAEALGVPLPDLTEAVQAEALAAVTVLPAKSLFDLEGIRSGIGRILPDHMVPVGYVGLTRLPMTSSGKIDRKALPDAEGSVASAPYVAPQTEMEVAVAEAIAGLLNLERVGLHDDFFALGGHSLLAVRLIARLQQATGRELPVRAVFEHPTVHALAAALEETETDWTVAPLVVADRSEPLPLSYQQERLWFLDQLDEAAGSAYHIESALELTGPLDIGALGEALRRVVDRHEGLRASFASSDDGRPFQVIAPTADAAGFVLTEEDAADLDEAALAARVHALLARPFDLASGPLFRAHLLLCGPQRSMLVVGGHHAVLDGWSVGLLLREVAALYGEAVTGEPAALPDLAVQYGDYAAWQRSVLSGDGLEVEMVWWRETLVGIPEAISLPFDRPRPRVMDYQGGTVPVHISADVMAGLKALAGSKGATLFMVLDAAFAAFLHRIGGDRDIVIGTAVAGRPRSELEPLAGFFVNTIALRHEIDGFETFTDFLGRTRQLVLESFAHQTVPFETIVEAVSPARSLGHAPVVQVMLTLQNTPDADAALALPDVTVHPLLSEGEAAKFDLSLGLTERAGGLVGTLSYAHQLFDAETAERLVAMFVRLLRGAVAAPETPVVNFPLLDDVERRQVVRRFNDTAADYPEDKTVVDLFAEQVGMRPDAIAVIDGERTLTYGALDAASNRLARHLIDDGVGPEQVVGVCLARSAELIVTLLAIWKAGGAYLPLDPNYPEERLAFMLADAGAMAVVTTENGSGQEWLVSGHGLPPVVTLDDTVTDKAIAAVGAHPVMDAERIAPLTPRCLSYVIYTSGSTGRPKGVSVSHAGLLNCSLTAARQRSFAAGQRALAHASVGFDASLFEWLPSLCSGASLSIWGIAQADPSALTELMQSQQVENVFLTPAVLKQLDRLPPDVGIVGVGGDRIDPGLVTSFSGQVRLVNCYGPTEGSIYASACTLSPETGPSIGRPVANTRIYIVDQNLEPQPIGVAGELLIGGVQVARGYAGRPGLTSDKFIADPFSTEPGTRLYRTGDLARWRPDGTIEFLGRIDHQVKIRGMRVELGEIEAQLNDQDGIRECVVVARLNGDGDVSLIAYLVPETVPDPVLAEALGLPLSDLTGAVKAEALAAVNALPAESLFDLEGLRAGLGRILPDHMVPAGYVGLTRLPMTSSGKIDRQALPDIEAAVQRAAYVAPQTEMEVAVAEAIAGLLNLDRVGVHDDFFALGGHSLLAVRLIARLQQATGRELPVRAVFEHPTVHALAAALESTEADWTVAPLVVADRSEPLPLSYQQERLWFLDQLDDAAGSAYHIESALELTGPLDIGALGEALRRVVDRHEGLRATFASSDDGRPAQVIAPTADAAGFVLTEEDAADLDEAALTARVYALLARPFDLATGPLFRAHLLVCGPQRSVLVVGGHHAVLDGWSVGLLLREVAALYREAVTGEPADLPDLAIQYGDYAAWQRSVLSGERLETEMAWWREALAGIPEAISLPFDRPRPKVMDYQGGTVPVHIPADVTAGLKAFAGSQGATLFMVLDAAFAAFLHRIGGDRDIVIGTAVAGRPRSELEPLAGFFVNTIALRHEVDGSATFRDHFAATKEVVLEGFAHETVPFETVVEAASPVRTLSHAPVVQVMLTLQNTPDADAALALPDVTVHPLPSDADAAKFDLSLGLTDRTEGLVGSLSYARQLFDAETAERLAAMFVRLLSAAVAAPETPVVELPLLDDAERRQVVHAFNETAADYPRDKTVMDLFAEQVGTHPQAVAVIDGERTLTYGALDSASNRLAQHLIDQGIGPEHVVGVCLERSTELIVTLLAIWKAGGAYLPLDPEHPMERLVVMLEDAGASAVMTTTEVATEFAVPEDPEPWLLIDVGNAEAQTETAVQSDALVTDAHRIARPGPDCLAYVIHTSGSTGKPKGVGVAHRGLLNYIEATAVNASFDASGAILSLCPLSFDVSIREFCLALAKGGRLVLSDYRELARPGYVASLIERYGVTFIDTTPALWEMILSEGWRPPASVYCVSGGDVLSPLLADAIREHGALLVNGYGPAENTIGTTFQIVEDVPNVLLIGRPLFNVRVYVVDNRLCPQPIGVAGELVTGGLQVARGYVGRPGLTAEKFVADPFSGESGARLYRTGDLARWRADGTIEFLGRVDHQVKIRGMRVELGEIEAQLNDQQGIRESVVVTRQNGEGVAGLVAYLVPESVPDPVLAEALGVPLPELTEAVQAEALAAVTVLPAESLFDLEGIRSALSRILPDHMVPAGYVGLTRLPLTASGKIDRKALPDAEASVQRASFVAPQTTMERAVADAMTDLLKLDRVGLHDNFFDLGGHSLLAVRLVANLHRATGRQLPVRSVFEAPTVDGLARALDEREEKSAESIPVTDRSEPLPLSYQQERLWFLDQLEGRSSTYNIVGAIRLTGILDKDAMATALRDLVSRHESLRMRFENHAGTPVQIVEAPDLFHLEEEDQLGLSGAALNDLVSREVRRPFDLQNGPVFRAKLIKTDDSQWVLIVGMHHIVSDGWSIDVLVNDLCGAYAARLEGQQAFPVPLTIQYADYAAWQRQTLTGQKFEEQLAYWTRQLAGLPDLIELPADRPRPPVKTFRGDSLSFNIDEETSIGLRALARRENVTMFMLLQAAFAVLVHRYSGADDFCVGAPVSGRRDSELHSLVGFFVNMLPIRHRVDGGMRLSEVLAATRQTCLEAFDHQDIPAEHVLSALRWLTRSVAYTPLIQIGFAFNQQSPSDTNLLRGLDAEWLRSSTQSSKTDLTLAVIDGEHALTGALEYSTDLFSKPRMEALAADYCRVLRAFIKQFGARVDQVDLQSFRAASANPVGAYYGLTESQKLMWLLQERIVDKSQMIIAGYVDITGPLDANLLKKATDLEAQRVRSVHVELEQLDLLLAQRFLPTTPDTPSIVDVSDCEKPQRSALQTIAENIADMGETRNRDLFRLFIIKLGPERHWQVALFNHIVFDGWSSLTSVVNTARLYDALLERKPIKSRSGSFLEALTEEHTYLSSSQYGIDQDYWRHHLEDLPGPIISDLSDRYDRDRIETTKVRSRTWTRSFVTSLKARAKDLGISFPNLIMTATAITIAQITGRDDFCLSLIRLNRGPSTLHTPGMMINFVPIRCRIDQKLDIAQAVKDLKVTVQLATRHGRYPTVHLLRDLRRNRQDADRLLDVGINVLQTKRPMQFGEAKGAYHWRNLGPEMGLDLVVLDTDPDRDASFECRFSAGWFSEQAADRIMDRVERVLHSFVDRPDLRIRDLPLMDKAERRRVIESFNATAMDYPKDQTVVDLFAQQVEANPEAIAVVDGDRELTYGELDQASNRLARPLIDLCVSAERAVGVCLNRSADLIISMLGIFKAGGAYLPLDPELPSERLDFMIEDAGAQLVITKGGFLDKLTNGDDRKSKEPAMPLFVLDDERTQAAIAACSADALPDHCMQHEMRSLAYVLYTSGSTGLPKGVMVGHQSLANLAHAQIEDFGLTSESRVAQFAAIGFDVSIGEIAMTLAAGASLYCVPADVSRDPRSLTTFVKSNAITQLECPASFGPLLQIDGTDLSGLVLSGEALTLRPEDQFCRIAADHDIRLINSYGPTEGTISATGQAIIEADPSAPVPIGSPMANTRIYVVEPVTLEPQPIGVAGELLIGGVQVARGYVKRPGLTAEKFIADPFSRDPGVRLYRTGDLARWRDDGTIEFLGRIDHQVKIRGMRVEPGEIEAQLNNLAGIRESVVTTCADGERDVRLIAYLVADAVPGPVLAEALGVPLSDLTADVKAEALAAVHALPAESLFDLESIRSGLKRILPDHMVPAGYVGLTRLPLTPSGKIDRKALPDVEGSVQRANYVTPGTQLEQTVAEAMAELLNIERVGLYDNFFDLGGHSLLAVRLVTRLQQATGRELPVRAVFETPTVEGLARALDDPSVFSETVSIHTLPTNGTLDSPAATLIGIPSATALPGEFADLAMAFGESVEFKALMPKRTLGDGRLKEGLAALIDAYVEAILDADLHPDVLVGYSLGGYIAPEIARRLSDEGRSIDAIVVVDADVGSSQQSVAGDFDAFCRMICGAADISIEPTEDPLSASVLGRLSKSEAARSLLGDDHLPETVEELRAGLRWLYEARTALSNYEPVEFSGELLVVSSGLGDGDRDSTLGWANYAKSVSTLRIQSNHYTILQHPDVSKIARLTNGLMRSNQVQDAKPHKETVEAYVK